MILISHRGNIDGQNKDRENTLSYINEALKNGFQVEIDVRYIKGSFYLGHDTPDTKIRFEEFGNNITKLWIHCKNTSALSELNKLDMRGIKLNYFSHDQDNAVLTSKGYIWSIHTIERGILVMPESTGNLPTSNTVGICSDNIQKYA